MDLLIIVGNILMLVGVFLIGFSLGSLWNHYYHMKRGHYKEGYGNYPYDEDIDNNHAV